MIADEIWILTAFSVVPQNFLILVSRHGTNQKICRGEKGYIIFLISC